MARREWTRINNRVVNSAFYELRGMPDSKFVGYLLTDHFEEFKLDIKSIWTSREADETSYMYVLCSWSAHSIGLTGYRERVDVHLCARICGQFLFL